MCMNCGCGEPEDRQGNDANITLSDLRRAAQANNMSVDQTIHNMEDEAHKVESHSSGGTHMSVSEASSSGMSGTSS